MLPILTVFAAAASTPQPITILDPAVFRQQLIEMGYAPDAYDTDSETALTTVLHLRQETLAIVLGGCTKRRNCSYAIVLGSFNNVKAPPAEWVAKMNVDYDLIKVWIADTGRLTYSDGSVVEGMSRPLFKAWIDSVISSSDALGREALDAGYGTSPSAGSTPA